MMGFGRRTLSVWATWLKNTGKTTRARSRGGLRVERLEMRQALAGDLALDLSLPPSISSDAEVQESNIQMVAEVLVSSDPLPANEPATGSSCCDSFDAMEGVAAGPIAPAGPGPDGPPGTIGEIAPNFTPPSFLVFDYAWSGNNITVYGQVIDDGPVGGLLVEFGGLLANINTLTDVDGWFSVTVQIGQTFGQVTAIATDTDGWTSEVASLFVW